MLIPLRTDRPPKRRPIVTESLLLINLLAYLTVAAGSFFEWFNPAQVIDAMSLARRDFELHRLVTYQFMHDPLGLGHIIFNMLFLWVFGCAVEDRLGRFGFAAFYLMGGAVAGIAHMQLLENPVIGASGSIAAVSGAFLALFPRSRIKVLFVFLIIGIVSIPSLWFIAMFFVLDVMRQLGSLFGGGGDNVAYMAHIAGYIYGFALAFTLLATRVLKREEFDIFFLITQARRRARFRAASRAQTGGMWDHASKDTAKDLERRSAQEKKVEQERPPTLHEERISALRAEIARRINAHEVDHAARLYRELLERQSDAVLSEQHQLDVANQLYAKGEHDLAAKAYELLISHYPGSHHGAEVRLILGLLYARQLGQPQRARELIRNAKDRLRDASQISLADQLLAELGT